MSGFHSPPGLNTYALLDQMVTILGTNKTAFYPFLSAGALAGTVVDAYGSQTVQYARLTPSQDAGAVALSAQFEPFQHPSGLYSYQFRATNGNHLAAVDNANHSHGNATVDTAFSIGAWVMYADTALNGQVSIAAKYRTTATTAREYSFDIDTNGQLILALYDESAAASEIATGATSVTFNKWCFTVATYDGGETDPRIHLYIDGVDSNSAGLSTETGSYVAMENTTTPLLFGAQNITTAPAQEFEGRMAMVFTTGKELTQANVTSLTGLGKILLGA